MVPFRDVPVAVVNHRALTSAVIDSRDFIAARRRAATEVMLPAGPKIAFTGGLDFNDHRLIWDKLDQVHTKHPDIVLLHGGSTANGRVFKAPKTGAGICRWTGSAACSKRLWRSRSARTQFDNSA